MLFSKGRKSILLAAGSVVALSAFAAPTFAQEANEAGEVVIVTGQRAQVKSAQKLKQRSEVIQDSITATDIGALPDRSVSEALQRVAGVTLQRTDTNRDPARLSGEGGGVFVRGLTFVRSELNGRDTFSAKNGRNIGFEDISADLMGGVDVIKSPSADMIEGAIGGTVNLRTRLPFDTSKGYVGITLDSNYGDLRKERFNSGSITASKRFDTSLGEFGILINLSESNVGTLSNSFSTDQYYPLTVGANTRYVPKAVGWREIAWTQKRTAVAVAAQWRPVETVELTLQYIDTKAAPKSMERGSGFEGPVYDNANSSYVYAPNGTFESGTFTGNGFARTRYGQDDKQTQDLTLSGRYNITDKLTLTGAFQRVESTNKAWSLTVHHVNTQASTVNVDLSGELPSLTVNNPETFDVESNYYNNWAMDHFDDNEAELTTAKIDLEYDFDSSWLKSVKIGARTTDKHVLTRESNWNWGAVSPDGAWSGENLTNDTSTAGTTLAGTSEYYDYGNFFRGQIAVPHAGWFPSQSMITNYSAYSTLLENEGNDLGWGWHPNKGTFTGQGQLVNDQYEETTAVYAMARYGGDDFLGTGKAFDGNFGVRAINTKTDNGNESISFNAGFNAAEISPSVSAATRAQLLALLDFQNTVTGDDVNINADYNNVLPSANFRLYWADNLQFRFAASQSIVRPELFQMRSAVQLSATLSKGPCDQDGSGVIESDELTACVTGVTSFSGTSGNPNLKPMEANQYDFSAEWYFAPTGSLTFAAFHKDLKNYFLSQGSTESYDGFQGVGDLSAFGVVRTRNGDKGKITGFELAYSQFYDFLPGPLSGLGIQANYTFVGSRGGANTAVDVYDPTQVANSLDSRLPLEGLSNTSYNFALMYSKYGIDARIAYNWREKYLLTTSAANINNPVWFDDYGQMDASVYYTVTPNVKVGVQITNLTKEKTSLLVGFPERTSRYAWFDQDRRVALGIRLTY